MPPKIAGVLLLVASAMASAGNADIILLVPPRAADQSVQTLTVTDARPAWQKKKEILSLWRTACDFAIVRWSDADSTPGRAQAVAEGLGRHLDVSFKDKPFKLTWFTLHTNRRAPPDDGYNPYESGLTYAALSSLECRKGGEIIGGVAPEEKSPPAPLVVDIVVEMDGKAFAGRAVASVADTKLSAANLVDLAMERLAKSIQANAPDLTPCQRLKKAWEVQPHDGFYKRSYQRYCLAPGNAAAKQSP
jgi:hypothetical protein